MTLELHSSNSGIPLGKAVIGGGGSGDDSGRILYDFKGSVADYAELLEIDTSTLKPGDVYDTQDTGMDYGWTGTAWNALGEHVDLSGYYTSAETDVLLGAKQNTLTAGTNVNISSENVISATDTTYTAGSNVNISSENVISATDTTYSAFTGADGAAAGTAGLVPAPSATDNTKFLKGDGTFAEIPTPDLSNYYTKSQTYSKAEADTLLDEKQDALTPNSPLSIETRAVSNLNGFDYTQDTTGIYTSDSSSVSTYIELSYDVTYKPIAQARVRSAGVYATNDEEFYSCGYIDIPFELNKTYSFPQMDAIFGKKIDGNFVPLFIITEASTNGTYRVTTSDTYSYSSGGDWTKLNTTSYKFDGDGFYNTTYSDGLKRASQFIEDTENHQIAISNMFPGNSDGYGRVNYYTASGDFYSRIKEVTICRLIPTGASSAGNPIYDINLIGKWDYVDSLGGLSLSALGTNEFDISGVETFNYLDLNIGAGLSKDGNGNLISDMTTLANVDLSNLTNTGKIAVAHNAMPSTILQTLTIAASGTDYVMPFDGYLYVSATSYVAPSYLSIDVKVNTTYYTLYGANFSAAGAYGPITLPVSKGMTVRVRYDGVTINSFILFATNGSESEVQ